MHFAPSELGPSGLVAEVNVPAAFSPSNSLAIASRHTPEYMDTHVCLVVRGRLGVPRNARYHYRCPNLSRPHTYA